MEKYNIMVLPSHCLANIKLIYIYIYFNKKYTFVPHLCQFMIQKGERTRRGGGEVRE